MNELKEFNKAEVRLCVDLLMPIVVVVGLVTFPIWVIATGLMNALIKWNKRLMGK